MRKNKKLKVGDRVICHFLGEKNNATVIEVTSPGKYKLECDPRYKRPPTILPNTEWLNEKDKKQALKPWHIIKYLGPNETSKSKIDTNTSPDTTNQKELGKAIEKQKDFIRGKYKH